MTSKGNVVATKPVGFQQVKAKAVNAFATAEQKFALTELEVVIDSDGALLEVGDKVYVKADSYVKPWSKIIYQVKDIEFVLVPIDEIVLLERKPSPRPEPLPPSSLGSL